MRYIGCWPPLVAIWAVQALASAAVLDDMALLSLVEVCHYRYAGVKIHDEGDCQVDCVPACTSQQSH